MFTDKLQFRIPFLKLLIGLLITVVPISLIALYAVGRADESMKTLVGSHFQSIAIVTAADVSQFVNDRVLSVGTLAANPITTEACVSANEQLAGLSPEAVQERMGKMENIWNTPAGDAKAREMLNSRASKVLNQYREIDRRFLRITLTDRYGGVIAATHKTLDYYQADEEFWQGVYSSGRGAVSITDILYDEVTKSNYIGLGVPVMAPGSNVLVGVLDALIEVSSLFPIVHRAQLGKTGRILLSKADGTVIQAPDTSLSMNVKSGEFAAIRDAGGLAKINLRGHLASSVGGVPAMIGYASTGLQEHYPNLGWSIVVAQDSEEALAPIRVVVRLISFMALVGLAMVTLMAVYFSLHREADFTDIKALHANVKSAP